MLAAKTILRAALLAVLSCGALFAQKPPAPNPPPGRFVGEIVTMETFEISAAKFQWRRAETPLFEILSSVNDAKLVAQIVRRAEQIIGVFQNNCPLFRPKNNRPVRLIFISDGNVERFLTRIGKDELQTARDRPPAGVEESGRRKGRARQVSARGYFDDEQVVLLKLIPKSYLDGATPFDERVRENALDLAINYLLACADTHIRPGAAPWLVTTLNSLRGHSAAGPPWRLPENFESAAYGVAGEVFNRPAWFTISDEQMTAGRYCLACETRLYRDAADFPRAANVKSGGPANAPDKAALIERQKAAWRDFLPAPRAGLRAVFEEPAALVRSKRNTMKHVERELCKQREALDFVYYCVFNADPKIRAAFSNFATGLASRPPDEKFFEKCFGVNHAAFHENIYAFYQNLARYDPRLKNNPWGPPAIVVAKFARKELPAPPVFRDAKRAETSLMIADWFTLCGAPALARQTLDKAARESAQARNDPEIKAAIALNEAAHGNKLKAIALLENAVAAKTARSRVYSTLSELLLADIFEVKGNDYRLAANDVHEVIAPLVVALKLPDPTRRVYEQLAAIWKHTDVKPPREYLEIIAEFQKLRESQERGSETPRP